MPQEDPGVAVFPEGEEKGADYRALPHNLEAEQALLGAVLVNNEAVHRVSGFLRSEHFFHPVHARIYEAAVKLVERGQIASPVTLKTYFENDEALSDLGGAQYLVRLAGSAVTVINAEDYGRQVHDLFLRRALIGIGETVVNTAYDYQVDVPAREQIEQTERRLFDLAEEGEYEGGFQPFDQVLTSAVTMTEAAFKREGAMVGVATGLIDLDNLLGGLHPSDLVIVAGRPGMGKTALATTIAFNAARNYREEQGADGRPVPVDGAVVGFFSLEMSAEQLATRMLAEDSGIPSEKLRRGQVSHEDFDKVVQASQRLSRLPFFIDDTPALSVAALRTRARRLKRLHGLSLVVVDYLQLVRPSRRASYESRVLEVGEITQGLKALAKELDVPVLAISQLSRAVEQREDKRPQLADLRESGAIEQDADVVAFIYREEYYLERAEPKRRAEEDEEKYSQRYESWGRHLQKAKGVAEVAVAKQRHGPIGKVRLHFNDRTTRFDNLDTSHSPSDVPF
ncbi:MAG: replicative DNA helicase [Alphaproteobacteria bacterium]